MSEKKIQTGGGDVNMQTCAAAEQATGIMNYLDPIKICINYVHHYLLYITSIYCILLKDYSTLGVRYRDLQALVYRQETKI